MITVYNFLSAGHVARVGIAIILVGDSVAMVKLGHKATKNVYIDAMTEEHLLQLKEPAMVLLLSI